MNFPLVTRALKFVIFGRLYLIWPSKAGGGRMVKCCAEAQSGARGNNSKNR